MQVTGIEWTDFSANPVKYRDKASGKTVWACVKHSPGCKACYAEALALRYGRGGPFTKESMSKVEPFLDEKELRQLLKSPKLAGKRVFVGDMTDVFGEWVPDALLDRLFAVFALRPDVTFQVLTKRAERLREYMTRLSKTSSHLEKAARDLGRALRWEAPNGQSYSLCPWPIPSVWLGASVENQEQADKRIPALLATPAAVRFLSCEPLLGEVDLLSARYPVSGYRGSYSTALSGTLAGGQKFRAVDWAIVGGESGPGARPCRVEWIRSIVQQCKAASVPVFCKQLGSRATSTLPAYESWPGHDGPNSPVQFSGDGFGNYHVSGLRDRKGGDIEEWPADLRVREFPEVRA